jgi:hypothetical protein
MAKKVKTFEGLVHRTLNDATFRGKLKADPEKALKSVGMKPTREQVSALQKIKWEHLETAAGHFERTQKKRLKGAAT